MSETELIMGNQELHFHVHLERDPEGTMACCGGQELADVGDAVSETLEHHIVGIGDKIVVEFLLPYGDWVEGNG